MGIDKMGTLTNPVQFNALLWNFKIKNRMFGLLTKSVQGCQAKIRFENIEGDSPLTWRLLKPFPEQFHFGGSYENTKSNRDNYLKTAGETYAQELGNHGIDKVDFLPLMEKECYFLVTIEGSELAYLVLGKNTTSFLSYGNPEGIMVKEFNGVQLILRIPSEHNIWLKFDGDGYFEERTCI